MKGTAPCLISGVRAEECRIPDGHRPALDGIRTTGEDAEDTWRSAAPRRGWKRGKTQAERAYGFSRGLLRLCGPEHFAPSERLTEETVDQVGQLVRASCAAFAPEQFALAEEQQRRHRTYAV